MEIDAVNCLVANHSKVYTSIVNVIGGFLGGYTYLDNLVINL